MFSIVPVSDPYHIVNESGCTLETFKFQFIQPLFWIMSTSILIKAENTPAKLSV